MPWEWNGKLGLHKLGLILAANEVSGWGCEAPDGPDRPSIEVRTTAFCAATEDEVAREEGRLPRGYTSRQSTTW